jgi:ceroid-lipofuscinosis MFS transporter 7
MSLGIAFIVQFLLMLQNSIFFSSLWPFVSKIDETADETFYGFLTMSFNLAATFASPLFGLWTNKIQQCRLPIILGVSITICGNVLLASVEAFDSNRKWILLVARIISGLGCGSYGSLYGYVVMASKVEERSRAISIRASLNSVALILGPALQTAFVPIGFPGFISARFHLDMYTATGWANVVAGLIQVLVLVTVFKEYWVAVDKSQLVKDDENKKQLKPFDMFAAFASIWIRFAYQFFLMFDGTIASPFSMLMFNWTAEQAVLYNGLIQIGTSAIDLTGNLVMGNIVLRYVEERKTMIVGLGSALAGFLTIYCWPGLEPLLPDANMSSLSVATDYSTTTSFINTTTIATTIASSASNSTLAPCDFAWCATTTRVTFVQYIIGRILLILSVSIGYTPNATIFSKTIGPRKQGTYQGIFAAAGQGAMTIAPIISTTVYQYAGPRVTYGIAIGVVLSAILMLAASYRRMVPWKDWDDNEEAVAGDETAPLLQSAGKEAEHGGNRKIF